jgi:two-component system, cell cycle sensor histidine kinase and response regulator CckA
MIHSLDRRYRRDVSANQLEAFRVSARAVDVDLTDGEIVQLVMDLRNQLTVMTLSVDAIRDGMAHGPAHRLSELQRSTELAVRQIEEFLIDGRRPQASARTSADLNEVVRRSAATLSHDEDNAIRVRLDLWPEPLGILAEPSALERVLLNLLLNAYDAMPDGGVVTITTAIDHGGAAGIHDMRPDPYARLIITDTGRGMTAEVKDRLFHGVFTTKPNGTGLGLRSVASTIRQHQGRISVESEPGQGTSVTVMLPLATGTLPLNVPASGCPLRSIGVSHG